MLLIPQTVIRVSRQKSLSQKWAWLGKEVNKGRSLIAFINHACTCSVSLVDLLSLNLQGLQCKMATYKGELSTTEVVKLIEVEGDEEGDILAQLGEEDIWEIYKELTPEDQKRFRQFRKFHHQYFGVFGEHLPSYQVARQVVRELMPDIPQASADAIAAK